MRVVLANGCFDLLHPGHVRHLMEARSFGDKLVVALTLDAFVKKEKGEDRPILAWADRAFMLLSLGGIVDEVVPSESGSHAILTYRPNIFAKGPDYSGTTLSERTLAACFEVGAEIRFTAAPTMSTSDIIRRIRN